MGVIFARLIGDGWRPILRLAPGIMPLEREFRVTIRIQHSVTPSVLSWASGLAPCAEAWTQAKMGLLTTSEGRGEGTTVNRGSLRYYSGAPGILGVAQHAVAQL